MMMDFWDWVWYKFHHHGKRICFYCHEYIDFVKGDYSKFTVNCDKKNERIIYFHVDCNSTFERMMDIDLNYRLGKDKRR